MANEELARLLQRLPIFNSLGAEEAVDLSSRCTGLRYKQGMRLFSEGEFGDSVMVVVSGGVQISCSVPDGPDLVVASERTGALLGEMSLLDPAPRSATATATEETVVLVIDGSTFADLVAIGHPAASGILRTVAMQACHRLRGLERKVDRLMTSEDGVDVASELTAARRGMLR